MLTTKAAIARHFKVSRENAPAAVGSLEPPDVFHKSKLCIIYKNAGVKAVKGRGVKLGGKPKLTPQQIVHDR
ncbi:MAG: hypothetical protein JO071_09740 [Deltaproteobacteria bacterium]|nr:hypothetical protein [Deltaproteobacteria bacterium]